MGYDFLYEVNDGVATLTFNRPEVMNALTFEVYSQLRDLFETLRNDEAVRVVVLTGAGDNFCSGGDVHQIIGELLERDVKGHLDFTRMTGAVVQNMRQLDKPIIAALNGTTAGAPANLTPGNAVNVSASSNLEVSGYSSVTFGALTINASTLTVTGSTGSALTFTGTTLTGSPTINVATGMTVTLGTVRAGLEDGCKPTRSAANPDRIPQTASLRTSRDKRMPRRVTPTRVPLLPPCIAS